jgi:Na+-transporting NADH:ubiquinone oxidoreductase subunit C
VRDGLYTLFYACIGGVVCAVVLSAAGRFAAPYRRANAKVERVTNVMEVLGVPFDADAGSRQILDAFEQKVMRQEWGGMTVYLYEPEGNDGKGAVAVPFSGPGLWGPVEGVLALEEDMKTVRAVTFYRQEETPGLGGEIGSDWFEAQFEGKSIVGPGGEPGIRVVSGDQAEQSNEVDAITGATMTSKKVEQMLNGIIERFMKEVPHHDG